MINKIIAAIIVINMIFAAQPTKGILPRHDITITRPAPRPMEIPKLYTDDDVIMLSRLIYTEARGVKSDMEKAAVVWTVCNRVDDSRWPDTIKGVVTQKNQFAYRKSSPAKAEFKELAEDVLKRWCREKAGETDVGRVLPKEYVFFAGRGGRNYFRTAYKGGRYWGWSLDNPYEN